MKEIIFEIGISEFLWWKQYVQRKQPRDFRLSACVLNHNSTFLVIVHVVMAAQTQRISWTRILVTSGCCISQSDSVGILEEDTDSCESLYQAQLKQPQIASADIRGHESDAQLGLIASYSHFHCPQLSNTFTIQDGGVILRSP